MSLRHDAMKMKLGGVCDLLTSRHNLLGVQRYEEWA